MRTERASETKFRIAETAMDLFLEHGYESVAVEAVAAASQVSRRTVFRHFDGKDELAFPESLAATRAAAAAPGAGRPGR